MATDFLKSFEVFGVDDFSDSGDGVNFHGTCPFSGKEKKFYVNKETGQWDSKVSGDSGNLYTFFSLFYSVCLEQTTPKDLGVLVDYKNLPLDAFIGKCALNPLTSEILIPTRNEAGKITDLGRWKPGSKMVVRTKNTKVGLKGVENLHGNNFPVYVCEGEWDLFALEWLHKQMHYESVVLCVPGANTFKDHWVPHFQKRDVYLCYDNDASGS
jgi:hypothetical protein